LKKPQAGFREGQMNGETQQFDGTFTVDVEDYFQVSAFSSVISPGDWGQYDCRVEQNTRRVLDIAAECGTRGTFFVLGWVAKHYPGLVSEIQDAGHEIGCHSQWHQLVYELGPDRFRSDLQESRDTLEQIIGKPVTLYRSPSFSITEKSLWALDILIEEGFDTDSSIYPVHHDRYGIPDAPTMPHIIKTAAGAIREFPGMVYQFGRTKLPVGGGGYLRLLPWMLTKSLLTGIRKQGRPLNVYIHPWEFDPEQPRIAASLKSRFRHYQNLKSTAPKIRRMLQSFRLTTMSEVLDNLLPARKPVTRNQVVATSQSIEFNESVSS
jgi:polysaccharide deacetylase family protein (PEP-CTERM system associated)